MISGARLNTVATLPWTAASSGEGSAAGRREGEREMRERVGEGGGGGGGGGGERGGESEVKRLLQRKRQADLLSKSTKKSILGTEPLSFNTLSRFPMSTWNTDIQQRNNIIKTESISQSATCSEG